MRKMKASDEDLSDGDFWDIGEDGKTPPKRKPFARGSTTFPSLSVYISCQEESTKEDTGNTVSISIPDIANVSELLINEQIEQETSDIRENEARDDNDDVVVKTVKNETDEKYDEDELLDSPNNSDADSDSGDHSLISSAGSQSDRDSQTEDDDNDNEVLFFDNSKQKNVKGGEMNPSITVGKKPLMKRSKTIRGVDGEPLLSSRLCPPHQLLKHWLYRGRKLLSASDGPLAVDAFVRAFALARIVHGNSHWRTARCKVFLARSYFYLLNYSPQAITHTNEASDVIIACLSSSFDLNKKPQIHHTLAWAYLVQGEAKTAVKMYQSAFPALARSHYHAKQFGSLISHRKRLKPSMQMDDPVDLSLKILCAQARLYEATNNIYKTRMKLEEALKNTETTTKTELKEMQTGWLLKLFGEFLLRHAGKTREGNFTDEDTRHELEEGIHCLRKSLEIIQKHKRPGSAKECEVRFVIAKHNLKYSKQNPKSIWWELHKLKIWSSRIHGELGGQTKAIQDCLIQVLVKEENFDEAVNELNEILIVTQNSLGDYNIQVCGLLRQLANVYMMKKDCSKALLALDQCLSVEMLLFGNSSRRVQTLTLKIKDLLFQVPTEIRKKMFKKHPELQQKPPFKSYC